MTSLHQGTRARWAPLPSRVHNMRVRVRVNVHVHVQEREPDMPIGPGQFERRQAGTCTAQT